MKIVTTYIAVYKREFFSFVKIFFLPSTSVLLDPSCTLSKPEARTLPRQLISFNGRESSLDALIKWSRISCEWHARVGAGRHV